MPTQAVQLSDTKNLLNIYFGFNIHHISFLGSGVEFFVAKIQASFEEAGVRVSEEAFHDFWSFFRTCRLVFPKCSNYINYTFCFLNMSFLGSGVEFFVAKFHASFEEAGVRVSEEASQNYFFARWRHALLVLLLVFAIFDNPGRVRGTPEEEEEGGGEGGC